MKQYVAIIRGINVGDHNRVNMKMLTAALVKAKLKDVWTYIQSGNVVLRSSSSRASDLEQLFNKILKKHFNADVPVIVREEKEWLRTVTRNPFLDRTDDRTKLLVTFLASKPTAADVRRAEETTFPHDDFVIDGKDIYLFCKNGYGKTDIPNTFFEKQLGVTATTRNWRTVMQLADMLKVER